MAAEPTATAILLQTRLTAQEQLDKHHHLPGRAAIARFEISSTRDFTTSALTPARRASARHDYIVRERVEGLIPDTRYYYRVRYGVRESRLQPGKTGSFRTLPGTASHSATRIAFTTCQNYYHFQHGKYDSASAYDGPDKLLGYPGLAAIRKSAPDYVVYNGDNIYYDHPIWDNIARARAEDIEVDLSPFDGRAVVNLAGMRRKYHEQYMQPRYHELWAETAAFYLKDDHDYRVNDSYPEMTYPISHALGVATFREQIPVVEQSDTESPTYRTRRINIDLQLWFVEGRDYRSPNTMPDGPDKSLWGIEQREWLQKSLLASDATFKVLVTPTPLVGPDDAYKRDNHTNAGGFRHEGGKFLAWLAANGFDAHRFFIVTGDRHWQYHSIHQSGYQEFSSGALDDTNARLGRVPGDPLSTDPDATIVQPYVQDEPDEVSGGFLLLTVDRRESQPTFSIRLTDEHGTTKYLFETAASDGPATPTVVPTTDRPIARK